MFSHTQKCYQMRSDRLTTLIFTPKGHYQGDFAVHNFWAEQMSEYLSLHIEYIKVLSKALKGGQIVITFSLNDFPCLD